MNNSEKRVYEAICSFMTREGKSPTYQDIQFEASGEMAWSEISRSLTSLVKQGAIQRPKVGQIVVPGLKMPKVKVTTKRRKCLDCGSAFESKWAGHRVCDSCKGTAAWKGSNASDYSAPGLRIA